MPAGADIEIVHDAPAQQLVVEIVVYLEEEIVVAAVEDDRQVAIPELRDEVDGRSLFPGFGMLRDLAQQLRDLPVLRKGRMSSPPLVLPAAPNSPLCFMASDMAPKPPMLRARDRASRAVAGYGITRFDGGSNSRVMKVS